jgi:hypothetical protein
MGEPALPPVAALANALFGLTGRSRELLRAVADLEVMPI